jgi:hypothetical protein
MLSGVTGDPQRAGEVEGAFAAYRRRTPGEAGPKKNSNGVRRP